MHAVNRLAQAVIVELTKQPELETRNLVMSPSSVFAALGVIMLGAGGGTKEELREALGGVTDDELRAALQRAAGSQVLTRALGVFVPSDKALLAAFAAGLAQLGAEARELPFGTPDAVARINEWVAGATAGRIPRLVSTLDPALVLLVVSALYFRARWACPFHPRATIDRPFTLRNGTRIEVPAMHLTATLKTAQTHRWQLVELGYRDCDQAMVVALPATPDGGDVELDELASAIEALEDRLVQLQLPRFALESAVSLREPLRRAGVTAAFDPARADFSAATPERVHASDVLHKACVAVTEEGTEAAAATAVPLARSLDPRPKVPFVVDRPFWFFIRERSDGTLHFVGRVEDPRG